MDRLTLRLATARRALDTLDELAGESPTKVIRDASIQRFEYSFAALPEYRRLMGTWLQHLSADQA